MFFVLIVCVVFMSIFILKKQGVPRNYLNLCWTGQVGSNQRLRLGSNVSSLSGLDEFVLGATVLLADSKEPQPRWALHALRRRGIRLHAEAEALISKARGKRLAGQAWSGTTVTKCLLMDCFQPT